MRDDDKKRKYQNMKSIFLFDTMKSRYRYIAIDNKITSRGNIIIILPQKNFRLTTKTISNIKDIHNFVDQIFLSYKNK